MMQKVIPFAVLMFFLLLAGCGQKDAETVDDRPTDKFVSGGVKRIAIVSRGDPIKAGDGVIKGRVMIDGAKPNMGSMVSVMTGHPECLTGASNLEKMEQLWIIGENGGVRNAVVFLKASPNKYFDPSDKDKKRADKVVLDQPHCTYIQHVEACYPSYWDGKENKYVATGQEFIVENSADFNHNVKWKGVPGKNDGGNIVIKSKDKVPLSFVPQPGPIQVNCDIHGWMNAQIWVFDHPYFAVTNEKGEFTIQNVPNDVELTLMAWHEATDYFHGGKTGTKMTLKPKEESKLDLKISAK